MLFITNTSVDAGRLVYVVNAENKCRKFIYHHNFHHSHYQHHQYRLMKLVLIGRQLFMLCLKMAPGQGEVNDLSMFTDLPEPTPPETMWKGLRYHGRIPGAEFIVLHIEH